MAKNHYLQQAHSLTKKHNLVGRWATEKLDGQRAFWDGGITRDMWKEDVPWANTDKDERYKEKQLATGLWSRYGNVIHAPSWFLDLLPSIPLDGELHAGRGKHQYTRSVVSQLTPDSRWKGIKFSIFNSPNLCEVFHDRDIEHVQYTKYYRGILDFLINNDIDCQHKDYDMNYEETQTWLQQQTFWNENLTYVQPTLMNNKQQVDEFYITIMSLGGEGVVFTQGDQPYLCERVHGQVKQKPYKSDEATVTGYVTGRETDKGSKLLGMMGALVCRLDNGKTFELSGFTNAERTLIVNNLDSAYDTTIQRMADAQTWASRYPETVCGNEIEAVYFPRGSRITFKYRELTDDGRPKEASYFRKREVE